jgi:hypothetical protein
MLLLRKPKSQFSQSVKSGVIGKSFSRNIITGTLINNNSSPKMFQEFSLPLLHTNHQQKLLTKQQFELLITKES